VKEALPTSISRLLADRPPVGVRFLEHTADMAIEVRARSLEACFARVAAGMFAVFVAPAGPRAAMESVQVDVRASGNKELLVAWLQELLYLYEVKELALQSFVAKEVSRNRVTGSAQGPKFGAADVAPGPAVKGVSRSGLQLGRTDATWHAIVIFDV
jgi:SHS2 domain-containing protein